MFDNMTSTLAVPSVQCSGALYAQGNVGALYARVCVRVCVKEMEENT